jgi:cell division ATPase FtsA
MSKNIAVGLDIGTYHVKVVIAESSATSSWYAKRILGVGFAESKGLRHGYIINQARCNKKYSKSCKTSRKNCKQLKCKKSFYFSWRYRSFKSTQQAGSVMISRADNEITELDVEKVLSEEVTKSCSKHNVYQQKNHSQYSCINFLLMEFQF